MSRESVIGLCAAVVLAGATGCAGARTSVVAPTAEVPVSMSRGVRDADGKLVGKDRRQVVGKFETKQKAWGMVWSFVSLTPERDISAAINEQVKRVGGDAVVSLTVGAAQCGSNFALILNILPFWPGCSNLKITGDIIKVAPAQAQAAPPTAPPPTAPPPPASPPPAAPSAMNDIRAGGDSR